MPGLDDTVQIAAQGRGANRRRKATRGFAITVVVSVTLHAAAAGAYMYRESQRPQQINFDRAIPVQLVKLGKKRDEKLLPRVAAPAPPPPSEGVALETKPKDPKDEAKKPAPKETSKEPELSKAAKRLLEPSALDRALSKLPPTEEEGDPNGDAAGTTTDGASTASGYAAAIIRTLRAKYNLPQAIPAAKRPFLKANVTLFIEGDGHVSRFEFVEDQGQLDPLFRSALESLLRTIVFPPPPKAMAATLHSVGIQVNFHP